MTFFWLIILNFALAAPKGVDKAAACVACHGPEGISVNRLWPNLAGQKEEYLLKQLKAFQNDERRDPLMSGVSKMLTVEDVKDLAKYYAELKGDK